MTESIQIFLIILAFAPIVSALFFSYQTMRAGFSIWGSSSLQSRNIFWITKLITASSFLVTALAAINVEIYTAIPLSMQDTVPLSQKVLALVMLLGGNLILISAQSELSIFSRVGLPKGAHALCTSGIYQWSRNPMYASLIFFFLACFLLNPNFFLGAILIMVFLIHLYIIKAEEKYLLAYFGNEYTEYRKKSVSQFI
ncbi:MAG: methyltransferase family protein [Mangrovibacterium sp.]